MFRSVLIANRGEIALRVTRTLRHLGVEAIAVYSDADEDAPHVRVADRAVRLGPALAAESYLHVERVVDAAQRTGAEAIHPGYGFLSERPDFAQACADAGIVFVGPSPEAMALLGDKLAAKDAAVAAGIPVVPGLQGDALSDEAIVDWVRGQKLPLLLKAAAGGGGRGMRVVRETAELANALVAARREARASFGDDRIFVERYVEHARHIEVQVIADTHGTVLHLGERECSLQRRHQKVIEEAPSPVVRAELRARLGAAAVRLARECGYTGAGTVELIADGDDPGRFFFLEMNARLQVEHPVTESVTSLDLVELQLQVAAGERLSLRQDDIELRGHAIEARIYAEDPSSGFLPSTGRVVAYAEPAGVRMESGVAVGVEVTADYDPLLAKLIVHAPDRLSALERLSVALGEIRIVGPATNTAHLRALLDRPEVRAGELDTALIERLGDDLRPPTPAPALAGAALITLLGTPHSDDPWEARDGWRLGERSAMRALLASASGDLEAWALSNGRGQWTLDGARAWIDGATIRLEGDDGVTRGIDAYREGDTVWLVDVDGTHRFALIRDQAVRHLDAGSLDAPMPGIVLEVRTAPGAVVEEGDVLVVLESMKMELAIASPGDGIVEAVNVASGDRVTQGAPLVVLAAPTGTGAEA